MLDHQYKLEHDAFCDYNVSQGFNNQQQGIPLQVQYSAHDQRVSTLVYQDRMFWPSEILHELYYTKYVDSIQ